jgi:hypothetical protein
VSYLLVSVVAELVDRPTGSEATEPDPTCVRDSVYCWTNVAVTVFAAVIETEHGDEDPVQSPVQPTNRQPVAGVAARLTEVWSSKVFESEPAADSDTFDGVDTTVPSPIWVTASAQILTNVAVTFRASVIVTVHGPDGLVHAPDQPANRHPAGVVVVRSTDVPSS